MINSFGNKIIVVGVSASGKSTFTRRLAKVTKLPPFYMDAIMWKSGWNYIGDEETINKLDEITSFDKWIVEGYISKSARTFIFERADKIIYLDYSPLVSSWRYVKRWWKHRKHSRPELEGSPEKFNFKFFRLIWTKGEAISLNHFLEKVVKKDKIIILKSPKEAERFLKSFL